MRTVPFLGGVVGGLIFTQAAEYAQFLASLDPALDIAGALSMVVFSGALIYDGAKALFKK